MIEKQQLKPAKIFTVIVTFNGMQWIEECLNSVVNVTSVIIVDNGSIDGTVHFVKANYKDVTVLEQKNNLGFGKANNVGITYALKKKADHVLLLNQDAKMANLSISKLLKFAIKNPNYGILSPIHCDWSGEYLESSFSRYVSQENNPDFYSDFVLQKPLKEVYELPFIAAACWFINKETLFKVGGFDPIFFHLGEDVNYAQRVAYHGFKLGVLPEVKVYHDTKNRKNKRVMPYSEDYYYKFNYRNKIKYADINSKDWSKKLDYDKNQVLKRLLVPLIKLNLKHIKGVLKEYRLLNKLRLECESSRLINVNPGTQYLNL